MCDQDNVSIETAGRQRFTNLSLSLPRVETRLLGQPGFHCFATVALYWLRALVLVAKPHNIVLP